MPSQGQLEKIAEQMELHPTAGERWLAEILKKWCAKRDIVWTTHVAMYGCIVDFFFPQFHLAVELDGSYHDLLKDSLRDTRLLENGVKVWRMTNPRTKQELSSLFYKLSAELRYQQNRRPSRKKPGFFTYSQRSYLQEEK